MQVPSQVWVGNAQVLKRELVKYLQAQFCLAQLNEQACGRCASCMQIVAQQFYNVVWLVPQNQYKVEQLREVLERLALRLAKDEQCFFVFQDAHCLNESSANSLLKSIEEPPAGYNFIFLVPRKELLLTTILSRSIIKNFTSQAGAMEHELVLAFTTKKFEPIEFNTLLEQHKDITDQESRMLLDQIYAYWLDLATNTQADDKLKLACRIINTLQASQDYLPMPGSSKLFWRNLYMQLNL